MAGNERQGRHPSVQQLIDQCFFQGQLPEMDDIFIAKVQSDPAYAPAAPEELLPAWYDASYGPMGTDVSDTMEESCKGSQRMNAQAHYDDVVCANLEHLPMDGDIVKITSASAVCDEKFGQVQSVSYDEDVPVFLVAVLQDSQIYSVVHLYRNEIEMLGTDEQANLMAMFRHNPGINLER